MTPYNTYGTRIRMTKTRKITAHVPEATLRRARDATGVGITETVRLGLELLGSVRAAEALRGLRGTVRLDLDLAELRQDRR